MTGKIIAHYFSFTKKERTGIIVIVSLILIISALPFFFPLFVSSEKYDPATFEKEIAVLKKIPADSNQTYVDSKYERRQHASFPTFNKNEGPNTVTGSLFDFDPNSTTNAQWKQLGIRDKTIATIQRYLNKGGKFYKPEDIKKIWGLHENEVQRLLPFVKINASNEYIKKEKPFFEKKEFKKDWKGIDINTADSVALVDLPGIGPGFAKRILNFRNRLGGFIAVDQLAETYGLPDSTFQRIKSRLNISTTTVKQIDINTAGIEEMKTHPYIRYVIANAIVQYRAQHGNYSSVADIKKIMLVTDDIFNKLAPYLKTVQ